MPGKYEIDNTSIDVGNFAILPIGGYLWITTLKISSTDGKNKKLAMCVRIDTRITDFKETRRGNRKNKLN